MLTFAALLLTLGLPAEGRPASGQTSVVVVMKMARCAVCVAQIRALAAAKLGVPLMGITHDSRQAAAQVTAVTGVRTFSHAEGIRSMGLWLADAGIAQPAVVVYDRCGDEAGRIVGRRPGVDVTQAVRRLVVEADAVAQCRPEDVS